MKVYVERTVNKQRMWTQQKLQAQQLIPVTVLWDFSGTGMRIYVGRIVVQLIMPIAMQGQQQIPVGVLKDYSGIRRKIYAGRTAQKHQMQTQKKPLAQRLNRATVLWDFFGTAMRTCVGKIVQQMRMPMAMSAPLLLSVNARPSTGGLRAP